jgi:hypothetical protein
MVHNDKYWKSGNRKSGKGMVAKGIFNEVLKSRLENQLIRINETLQTIPADVWDYMVEHADLDNPEWGEVDFPDDRIRDMVKCEILNRRLSPGKVAIDLSAISTSYRDYSIESLVNTMKKTGTMPVDSGITIITGTAGMHALDKAMRDVFEWPIKGSGNPLPPTQGDASREEKVINRVKELWGIANPVVKNRGEAGE